MPKEPFARRRVTWPCWQDTEQEVFEGKSGMLLQKARSQSPKKLWNFHLTSHKQPTNIGSYWKDFMVPSKDHFIQKNM